jgi:AmmeMemoRadiSam system protein B
MNSSRRPAAAGTYYEADADALRRQVESCFTHELGPGSVPAVSAGPPRHTVGLVCPHAGLAYSGPAAACSWAALAADGTPQIIVILGPNHYGIGPDLAVPEAGSWLTPLGEIQIADDVRSDLLGYFYPLRASDEAHAREHSIEVQLPFVQFLFGDEVRIVPIAIAQPQPSAVRSAVMLDIPSLGRAIAKALAGRPAVIAASTDLTHQEPQESAQLKDKKALDQIEAMDPERFLETVDQQDITTCGPLGVAAMLAAAKQLGATTAEVLRYHTSGDVGAGRAYVVGYGAVRVGREAAQ